MEREDERESCPGDKRGAAEEAVGVAGGVSMFTLDLVRLEVEVDVDMETPDLMAGLLGTPVRDGSMAQRTDVP